MKEGEVEIIEPKSSTSFFKKQRKTIDQIVPNNRGRKWIRDQLSVTTVITGVAFLSGISLKSWFGINVLSLPVTAYYARRNYDVLSDEMKEIGDQDE